MAVFLTDLITAVVELFFTFQHLPLLLPLLKHGLLLREARVKNLDKLLHYFLVWTESLKIVMCGQNLDEWPS